ncbi:hypothetical protein HZB58_02760 [Candidatus Gottesmanbacteria bacterium]|nr:hypothetical protein [Candidatus Gottesmanbacteria bacterium]
MAEVSNRHEPLRKRIFDEPFEPASPGALRAELGKAGMLSRRDYATGKKIIVYPDELIFRLFDEYTKGQRSFYRTRYEGQRQTVVESGMNTFRGKIYRNPGGKDGQYLVQCAGNVPVSEFDQLGVIDPHRLPPGFILKRDSSTSGKLLINHGEDPEAALFAETGRQLEVTPADLRSLRRPEKGYEEQESFLFPKLRTRFNNITFFLEMLASGYKSQYVMKGKPKEIEGVDHYPVTVSTWIPEKTLS